MKRFFPMCHGHAAITRRHFLFGSAASAASAGLLLAHDDAELSVSKPAVTVRGSAKTCIYINLFGGASHLDTFDPKDGPWNPPDADIREYPGRILLSRTLFPQLSALTSHLCILRSVQSWEAAHERGQFYVETGHALNPALAAEIPHIGAVVAKEKAGAGKMPPFLGLNQPNMKGATFLGGKYAPMQPSAFSNGTGLNTLQHNFYGANSRRVFEDKFQLLEALDEPLRRSPYNQLMADYTNFYKSARDMMYDDAIADVFKFTADERARYGATSFGNSLIMARNAVRAANGAVFISVTHPGWDTHDRMFDRDFYANFYKVTESLDRGLGSMIADLRSSGHLDSTLIVAMGEFGRTPGRLTPRGGRDHYRNAMSVLMAGGGVRGGKSIGATDATGAQITDTGWQEDRGIYPEDIACTIYSALGIDWTKSIDDTPSSRRFHYVEGSAENFYRPVAEVFA